MVKYSNYFKNNSSYGTRIAENSPSQDKEMERKFGRYIYPKAKILEIGTGLWTFASYCSHKGVKDYTGIEIDKWIAKAAAKYFKEYSIHGDDAIHFLKKTKEKYDTIFMSHVFEHFSIEEGITLANQVLKHLKPHGKRINIMPNAGCISAGVARYNDITHKVIYTSNSFSQVLLEAGFDRWNIQHFNVYPAGFIKKMFFKLSWAFLSIEHNTFELMSVISNK